MRSFYGGTKKSPFRGFLRIRVVVGQHGVMTEPNGFYYMRARYYDPEVGRFISEDPLGFAGRDLNLYVYALNNPILFVDPWGLCAGDSNAFGDVLRGAEFGVRAAARVTLDVADMVFWDTVQAVTMAYGGKFIKFPAGGAYAIGNSVNAIKLPVQVVGFQERAINISNDLERIRADVFDY